MKYLTIQFIVLFCISSMNIAAQNLVKTETAASKSKKPKVALVLSGGGAKGIAHIPTLQMLDSLGIVPDLVVGNSMGSIVGALYATGYSGDSIVSIVKEANWDKLMGGGVSLRNVGVEEKPEFNRYALEVDFVNRKLDIGNSILNDQNLREFIAYLTYPVYDINNFDNLPIPYRAIATDIVKGEEIILSDGSLALAMRASMSIPGVFQAVSYKETLLVDGGLLNNFPTDIAKMMGAEIIIGSDVGAPTLTKDDLEKLQSLIFQTTMLSSNIKRPENRALCDVLIDHGGHLTYSTGDFNDAVAIYEQGKIATYQNRDALSELAENLKTYRQKEVVLQKPENKFLLDSIIYEGIGDDNLALIKARTGFATDTPYDVKAILNGLDRAIGTRLLKKISHDLELSEGRRILKIDAQELSSHRIKGALHYDSFNGAGIIANYTGRNVIGKASRLLLTADIAEQPRLRLQYQKNFGSKRNWWWRSELYGQQIRQDVFSKGEFLEDIRNRYYSFDNQINLNINPLRNYLGFGIKYHNTNLNPRAEQNFNTNFFDFTKYDNYDIEIYAHYNYNSMNEVFFATEGKIFKGFVGRSLSGNLELKSHGETVFDDKTAGFTRFGLDYEQRFSLSQKLVTIMRASSHFILEDVTDSDDALISGFNLNSKYFLGGNIESPRDNYFLFRGLKNQELAVSQFINLDAALQYNVAHNIYITPHVNLASVGFGQFDDYLENIFSSDGSWSDANEPSFVLSAGTTLSYNSILGPINFDMSYVNDIDQLRFFIGIGFHLGNSN